MNEIEKYIEKDWINILDNLVNRKIISRKEITILVLESLQPPQVGGVANKKHFQEQFEKRKAFKALINWLADQKGCNNCGTFINLQLDHKIEVEKFENKNDADTLDNFQLLCRRCNVRKQESVKRDPVILPSSAMIQWAILVKKCNNFKDLRNILKEYKVHPSGRPYEGWAIKNWINE